MKPKVLVLGGLEEWVIVYVDEFPTPKPQTVFCNGFHRTIGGTGYGKAISLSRLGFDVSFHSTIGDDELGQTMRDILANEVNFVYDIDPIGTRQQIHVVNNEGERLSYFVNHGSLNPAVDMDKIEDMIIAADILVLNTINYTKSIIPIIKRHGKDIWCDIHDYHESKTYFDDFLNSADYIQFSSYHMSQYRKFMERLIDQGKKLVLCTHAHEGATALTSDGKWVDLPAVGRYARADPNGAGDSFFAGVLFGLNNQFSIEIALRFGIVVSGLCVTTPEPFYPGLSVSVLMDEYRQTYGSEPVSSKDL